MSHVNATLTPRTRLRLARLVVEQGWSCAAGEDVHGVGADGAEVGGALPQ